MRNVVPASATNWICTFTPVVVAVNVGGNDTMPLGRHPAAASAIVVTVVSWFPPDAMSPLTLRSPVPETRRTKKRIDGVEEFTHSQGLLAVPPPGIWTECVPAALSSVLPSPFTMLAPPPHDQPLAPLSKVEPWNGAYRFVSFHCAN